MNLPERVRVVEVGPRDGLQNESEPVAVATRIALIDRLSASGLSSIETGAFVSSTWVPQMAGTAEVLAGIQRAPGVSYPVLVPNLQGLDLAVGADVEEIAVFAAASESFSQKNINCSIDDSLRRFESVVAAATESGIRARGYVSCVLGCPYEGEVAPPAVAAVAAALYDMGCYEISLGDTLGTGTPGKAQRVLETVAARVPVAHLAGHYHDTYGQAIANVYASLELGVATFDASIAGLGGCPYAPGASGNVATEDLVYLLHGLGIEAGVDLDALVDTAAFISDALGRPPASKVTRAILAKRGG